MERRRWPIQLAVPAVVVMAAGTLGPTRLVVAGPTLERTSPPLEACRSLPAPGRGIGGWWRLDPSIDPSGTLIGWRFQAGRPDEPTRELSLPAAAAADGPIDGLVAVTTDDGRRSRVTIVALADACTSVAYESAAVVRRSVVGRTGHELFVYVVDRTDRSDLGVWRVPLGGPVRPTRILAPLPTDDPSARRIGRVWTTDLRLDDAGGRLAVQSCGNRLCLLRIVDLATGAIERRDGDDQGDLIGFDDDHIVTWTACDGLPCSIAVSDATTDGIDTVLEAATWATTTRIDGGLTLLARRDGPGGEAATVAVDLTSRRVRTLTQSLPTELLASGARATAGVELPDGFVAAAPGEDRALLAFDTAADRLMPAAEIDR